MSKTLRGPGFKVLDPKPGFPGGSKTMRGSGFKVLDPKPKGFLVGLKL